MHPLGLIFLLGVANAQSCYNSASGWCDSVAPRNPLGKSCNASYSGISHVTNSLSSYANKHVLHSFDFLLMAANFEHHDKNREGFSKLFKQLSDTTWDDAIDLIKYITKRGGEMNFRADAGLHDSNTNVKKTFETYELEALSQALDIQKSIAEVAHVIHSEVSKRSSLEAISHSKKIFHDAETMSYIEEKFVGKHADIIRDLAGYVTDLGNFAQVGTSAEAVYIFDEYLQKKLL